MAVSFIGLLLIALAFGLLLSARTRVFGFVILALVAFGLMSVRVEVSRSPGPSPPMASLDEHRLPAGPSHEAFTVVDVPHNVVTESLHLLPPDPPEAPHADSLLDSQAASRHAEAAKARAEILKNQRLAAQMPDAVLQISPDGSKLETYPDGMQVREDYTSRQRSIIHEADPRLAHVSVEQHARLRTDLIIYLLGLPLVILVVAFLAMRRRTSEGRFPLGLTFAGLVGVVLLGAIALPSMRSASHVAPTPVSNGILDFDDAQAAEVELSAASGESADGEGSPAITPAESIESLWQRLTKPRIELESPQAVKSDVPQAELVRAARIILLASAPVADPFTQSWLVNAAKAIIQTAPKAGEDRDEAAGEILASAVSVATEPSVRLPDQRPAESSTMYPAVQEYVYDNPTATEDSIPLNETDKPRPVWVGNQAQSVGNTQRVTVSTDPYTTAGECGAELSTRLQSTVQSRLAELARAVNGGEAVHLPELERLGVTTDYILAELCPEDVYVETISTSVGPMKRAHALVEFNSAQDRFLLTQWMRFAREENLHAFSILSSLVICGLAFVYGLLKVDTWTRGYYTKRLFLGVPAAIIAVFFVAALLGA